MPAHYVWTPSGHLFVAGYWDLPLANRGLMFAPVYYSQPVYAQPNFVFTPSISIVGPAVTANLFVQASTNQYLFGNYYPQNFVSLGITPWFSFTFATGRPAYYDPLFSYYAVINVQRNPAWVTQIREQYILRRENVALRPPVTFVEQTRLIERNVTIRAQRHSRGPSHAGDAAQQARGRSGGGKGYATGASSRRRARADSSAGRADCISSANSGSNKSKRVPVRGQPVVPRRPGLGR